MGTLLKKLDLKALGYDGSFERLVSEVSEIVSKDDNMDLFLRLLTERVFLDLDIERMGITNGVKAIKDQEKALFKWRSSAVVRASGVLPFLEKGIGDSASIPRKRRSPGVGCGPSRRKPEDSWFNQFRGQQFLADWYEKEYGIKLPIAQEEEEEEEELLKEVKKRKVYINSKNINLDRVPQELPADLRRTIVEEKGGSEPVLVITKVLFPTDTSTQHGRLSIPAKQIRNNFLTEEDEAEIKRNKGLAVGLIEPCGDENKSMRLTKWEMGSKSKPSNPVYNLISGWNSVVMNKKNGLKGMEGKVALQLWSFRRDTKLWFALVKVVPDEDQDDNGAIQGN